MNSFLQSLNLKLLHVGFDKLDYRRNYNKIINPFTRLLYVTKGSAIVNHTNQTFYLKPGYIYLIPNYVYNSFKCGGYHEQYYLGFFEEIQPGLSIHNLKHFKYEVEASQSDITCFNRLIEINPGLEIKNNTPKTHVKKLLPVHKKKDDDFFSGHYIETQGLITVLLSRFVEEIDVIQLEANNSKDLNKVLIYISKNLQNEITVKILADYLGYSADHFSRSFIKKFGIKPIKYIQSKRIDRAQFLLLSTPFSLKQIARDTGFDNISYFYRTFRKITGKTPASYRKEQLNT